MVNSRLRAFAGKALPLRFDAIPDGRYREAAEPDRCTLLLELLSRPALSVRLEIPVRDSETVFHAVLADFQRR